MRIRMLSTALLVPLVLVACQDTSAPSEDTGLLAAFGNGAQALANGSGAYSQPLPASLGGGAVNISLDMTTVIDPNGVARGEFRHSTMIQGLLVEFSGIVTCAVVNAELKRAWIGGVITANNSQHPSFTGAINQPGKDAWFRVADRGAGGSGDADRSTFLGFEGGAGIITSEEYCGLQIWPNEANPLVSGNLTVK